MASKAAQIREALAGLGSATPAEVVEAIDDPEFTVKNVHGQLSQMCKAGVVTSCINKAGRVEFRLSGGGA